LIGLQETDGERETDKGRRSLVNQREQV
jgi:hypothetical protein